MFPSNQSNMPAAKKFQHKTIHDAVKNGDVKELAGMVKSGANVNEIDNSKDKFTPLHWACYEGALECLHWLLFHGADPLLATPKGWMAAHIAAIRGQEPCLQALINNGCSIKATDLRGSTPLHMSSAHGHSFSVQTLLRAGAEVNVADKNGWTPVHYAAFHGRLTCLQPLVRWGGSICDTDSLGNTPVIIWLLYKDTDVRLVSAHLAAMEGHLQCVKFLVAESRNTVLTLGARNNNGDTPKLLAVQFHKQLVIDYINNIEWESEHPEETQNLAFPAHVAAYDGDLNHLRMLIENKIVNINERDDKGSTAAHKAAGQGHLDVVQWLLEMGADMTIENQAGETARDVAKRFARLAVVRILSDGDIEDELNELNAEGKKKKKKKNKKKEKKEKKRRQKKRIERVINTDGEEEEVEFVESETATSSSSSSSSSSSDDEETVEAKARSRKVVDKLERQLEVAKKNYVQLGGQLDEKDEAKFREEREQRRRLAEVESMLEAERNRRERLEGRIDEYRLEISHLQAQIHHDESRDERAGNKKKSTLRKRSVSRENRENRPTSSTRPQRKY